MATTSKSQNETQAQTKLCTIDCEDDSYRVAGGVLKASPIAINPNAGATELALGVQTRLHRLHGVMRAMEECDQVDSDQIFAMTGYVEEIQALIDAACNVLQYGTQWKTEAANG